MLDKETKQLINSSRVLGNKVLSIYLEDDELIKLCIIAANDLTIFEFLEKKFNLNYFSNLPNDYFSIPIEWFNEPVKYDFSFESLFLDLKSIIQDFPTYFKNLCEIHKRRKKFSLILQFQPLPLMEQIVPRSLLEFGTKKPECLASWLIWRKWLYDIDNRSAQETGYLFEPILTSAIGGVSYAASKSPVKRTKDNGKGRQVDCLDGKLAYEFKMRVTIAASGQGRFQEELDFAEDCYNSEFIPILLVLDPTPSARLNDLVDAYSQYGGKAFIGPDAWDHVINNAGSVMGVFVRKYVQIPLKTVDESNLTLHNLKLEMEPNCIKITIGDETYIISRNGICEDLLTEE